VADTPEQIAYDNELAKINSMPMGDARATAREAFKLKYPNGRPGTTGEQTPEEKEKAAMVAGQAFGFLKKFLDEYPEDTKLKESWLALLANDIAGARLAFYDSQYYQNTLGVSDQRNKRRLSQPGVYAKELADWIDTQVRRLTQAGIKLDPNDEKVKSLLESAYLTGDSNNQIDIKALAYTTKGKVLGGTTGSSVADLRAYAKSFGMKYSDSDIARWSQDIFAGRTTKFDIEAQIRQDAASAFPFYADKILDGTSLDAIGSAYKSSYANILEVDADSVDWTDPTLRKAMQNIVDGKPSAMPIWQFERELRKDPRWQYTDNANKAVYDAVYSIGTEWGLI